MEENIDKLKSGLEFCKETQSKAKYMTDHINQFTRLTATEDDFRTLIAVSQWAIDALNYAIQNLNDKKTKETL